MTSKKYEMWVTHNAEADKLRLHVLPESIQVSMGSKDQSVTVVGLGEIIIAQSRPAVEFSFSSFLPSAKFPGISASDIEEPNKIAEKLAEWKHSKKPVHFILTGLGIDIYCRINKFVVKEKGGDTGTLYYDISFKEYREPTVRQVNVSNGNATVEKNNTRTDNSTTPSTYTVKSGDCLWNLAKKFYGSGSKHTIIYNANTSVIGGNPNLIYPGPVLTIPAA